MATAVEQLGPTSDMPNELSPHSLRRRAALVIGSLAVLVLIAVLAPGLAQVRTILSDASIGWLLVAIALELASCASYVFMFRPVFCTRMPWRSSWQIGLSELATGSIVPASGGGGAGRGARGRGRGGPARGGHAGRPDPPPLGRVLPDQELGELRRRGGDRHRDGARPGRARH